jgi:N-glycosylase/DNA lyase
MSANRHMSLRGAVTARRAPQRRSSLNDEANAPQRRSSLSAEAVSTTKQTPLSAEAVSATKQSKEEVIARTEKRAHKDRLMPYRHTDTIIADHSMRSSAIRTRLGEFAAVPRELWFYELAYCLLTPQSSAVNASLVVDALQAQQFLERSVDPTPLLRDRRHYIRFHNTKSSRLLEARETYPFLLAELDRSRARADAFKTDGYLLRDWLLASVRGLGWKEASHFLRNIGYQELAILDRHILRNLKYHGVIRTIPKTLTPKRYVSIERAFMKFAAVLNISMDELDLLFWSRETGEIRK